ILVSNDRKKNQFQTGLSSLSIPDEPIYHTIRCTHRRNAFGAITASDRQQWQQPTRKTAAIAPGKF
ncbi:hypothetical protein, partial [Escherichia coli]|uniref:hypothetical protein n=1 Tax=Escherichia coli TaxID=562 RepID=UPI001BC857EE